MRNLLFYFAILSLFFTSCVNEEYYTPQQMNDISIFKVGDIYELVNDSGEIIKIRVLNKTITNDKHKYTEWPVRTKYEILTYYFAVETNSKIFQGTMQTISLDDFDESSGNFEYEFTTYSWSIFGGYIDAYCNDTLTIDNVTYNNVSSNCHEYYDSLCTHSLVISKELGIVKYLNYVRK